MRAALVLLLLTSCATLNTTGMTEACAAAYNQCLNRCPSSDGNTRRPVENQNGPEARFDDRQTMMIDVASCTADCNSAAKVCR